VVVVDAQVVVFLPRLRCWVEKCFLKTKIDQEEEGGEKEV
jgi:hypothetical protein